MPLLRRYLPKTRNRRLALVAVVALVGAGAWWWLGGESDEQPLYTVAHATRGNLEETVSAQGTLEPKEFVKVGAQVSGQLQKLHVDVGDTVSPSQLVAEIDPRVYESRLQESEAQVKSLRAQLTEQKAQADLARQQHGRNAQLVEAQAISRDAFDTSAAALKAAEARTVSIGAQIEQSESTLKEAQTNLSYTKIYAPIGGTVISQTAREGQTLNANQTAPTVVEVANLDVMTVRAQVAEADVGKVMAGMPVQFTTLGSEKPWKTDVKQVIPSPEIVNDVVLYNVLADIDNTERKLMSGMSTQMSFIVGKADNAILIPSNALGKKLGDGDDGKKGVPYQVFVPAGNGVEAKTVRIGLMNRSMAEVVEGLKDGDAVAVPTGIASLETTGGGGGNRRARAMGPRL
ncbi:MAG: efflux RND transporter periplasmic adaptor subunit [Alphaproteobacteria bacterium]|nr:MAG: efflux RND transporter periplasmic adaptor subunit [Alphaproteobacteria bacterium]